MRAEHFRNLYDYHFALNRKIWDQCIADLSKEQFKEKLGYSTGSIRNQAVHILNVDDRWSDRRRYLQTIRDGPRGMAGTLSCAESRNGPPGSDAGNAPPAGS